MAAGIAAVGVDSGVGVGVARLGAVRVGLAGGAVPTGMAVAATVLGVTSAATVGVAAAGATGGGLATAIPAVGVAVGLGVEVAVGTASLPPQATKTANSRLVAITLFIGNSPADRRLNRGLILYS